jgi:Collagen triple helix repeat (20 copies)
MESTERYPMFISLTRTEEANLSGGKSTVIVGNGASGAAGAAGASGAAGAAGASGASGAAGAAGASGAAGAAGAAFLITVLEPKGIENLLRAILKRLLVFSL